MRQCLDTRPGSWECESTPTGVHTTTLNETLKALGYTKRRAYGVGPFQKEIVNHGAVIFTGTAGDVWEWLHDTKQIDLKGDIPT